MRTLLNVTKRFYIYLITLNEKEKLMKKLVIIALICIVASKICIVASSAYAESKPFQLSLTPGIAIHSEETFIKGVTLNIWGENPQAAFAFGFVNGSSGNSAGFSWGLVNYAENYTGVEWGTVNYAKGNFKGLQSGFFNYAGKLKGLQFGAINYAKTVESGLQIGLVNIIEQNKWFTGFPKELAKGMVFVNWRF